MRVRRGAGSFAILWMVIFVAIAPRGLSSPGPGATIAAPTVKDLTLTPGKTFTINITVANVQKMWSFQFVLYYDPKVLTAIDYSFYDPFISELPSEIDLTAGYVSVARGMEWGTPYEDLFSTVDPKPIASITFSVEAIGASKLDIVDRWEDYKFRSKLTTYRGEEAAYITHDVVDGFFANTEVEMSVDPYMSRGDINATFSINITLTKVENVLGYEFVLGYDASILNATGYASYDPFTVPGPSEINETAGFVMMNYSIGAGQPGFSTVEPKPVARIDFKVKAKGKTVLDLRDTKIIDVNGESIGHWPADGLFANTHDIALISVIASSDVITIGESATIDVTVRNEGGFDETFSLTVYYGTHIIETKTGIFLEAGKTTTVSFTWDTSGADKGSYALRAEATLAVDDDPDDNSLTGDRILLKEPGTNIMFYIGVGVAVVVAVAVVAYLVKVIRRRSK